MSKGASHRRLEQVRRHERGCHRLALIRRGRRLGCAAPCHHGDGDRQARALRSRGCTCTTPISNLLTSCKCCGACLARFSSQPGSCKRPTIAQSSCAPFWLPWRHSGACPCRPTCGGAPACHLATSGPPSALSPTRLTPHCSPCTDTHKGRDSHCASRSIDDVQGHRNPTVATLSMHPLSCACWLVAHHATRDSRERGCLQKRDERPSMPL